MRKTKIVYSFTDEGVFIGTDIAWESWDLDGTFLLPANSTDIAPPQIPAGYVARWNDSQWNLEIIPLDTEPALEFNSDPEPITWEQIRSERNYLLSQTDWIFAPDVILKNKEAWITYRQALRNIPQTYTEVTAIIWPVAP
jgi:hypothetical protein